MKVATFLLAAASLLPTAAAFHCNPVQSGECYYYQGDSKHLSRCAISCSFKWWRSKCKCPKHYPNKPSWDYAEIHDCISWPQYNTRNKCQDANPQKRDEDDEGGGPEGIDAAAAASNLDGRDLDERNLADYASQDHDLPMSLVADLRSGDD